VEAGVVHLLRLDVVLEELLPLGEHLIVEHIPGELLLHASKEVQTSYPHPSLSSWLAD
jgi:hypothetical protein